LIGLRDSYGTELNPSEISLLMKMKASDFMLEMVLTNERLHSSVFAMKDYQARYEAIYAMMPPAQGMTGPLAQHIVTQEEFKKAPALLIRARTTHPIHPKDDQQQCRDWRSAHYSIQ
jgi:hypothetical protein